MRGQALLWWSPGSENTTMTFLSDHLPAGRKLSMGSHSLGAVHAWFQGLAILIYFLLFAFKHIQMLFCLFIFLQAKVDQ